MSEIIHEIIDKNFNDQVVNLQKLLRMNSVYSPDNVLDGYPLGKNLATCLNEFLELAEKIGFKTKNIENTVGWAEIGEGEKLYGILAHLDTVPLGDEELWITPPLEANIIGERLYGRGSTDDKGPAISALYALLALKESGTLLNKRFRIIVGLDEETKFRCVKRYLETEEVPDFSFSPDASFPVINGEKGKITFSVKRTFVRLGLEPYRLLGLVAGDRVNVVPDSARAYFGGNTAKIRLKLEELNDKNLSFAYVDDFLEVTARGKSAHAMNPEKGINAIQRLFHALSQIEFAPVEVMLFIREVHSYLKMETDGTSLGIACEDEISGKLTINTAVINYKDRDLLMKFNLRYPITVDPEIMESKVKTIAENFGTLYQITDHTPPLFVNPDLPEIQLLLKAYEKITGEKGEPTTTGGGTYCRAFPFSVSFGGNFPYQEELAHEINEYAELKNLKKMTHVYGEALKYLNAK